MKKYLFLISQFAAIVLVACALTACGEDVSSIPDGSSPQKGKTEFTTGDPKALSSSGTRTTTDDDRYFYWTAGDNIWVEKTAGTWVQSTTNNITATQASAKFYFDETLSENSYNVRYTGQGSTSAQEVTIAAVQTQKEWSNGEHIAVSGDCGLATATHQGEHKYKFSMKHQAAYIILYPYMVSSIPTHYPLNRTYTLMKVEVKSTGGAEIAGTYNFSETGITGAATANASDIITLNCGTNGFALENNSNPSKHYLVVVMRPIENNKLTFTYYIKDNTDGTIFTYEVSPGIRTYSANGFTAPTHPMTDMVFDKPTYYRWGTNTAYNPNVQDGPYNTVVPSSSTSFYTFTNGEWANTPNANRMYWYAQTAIVDDISRWRLAGESTFHSNGVWMKRISVIAADNNKTLLETAEKAPDGKDWRTDANLRTLSGGRDIYRTDAPATGSPAYGIIHNYFYLPCFGMYNYPAPNDRVSFGSTAYYWSSTAGYEYSTSGHYNSVRFAASRSTVNINLQDRRNGFVISQGRFK